MSEQTKKTYVHIVRERYCKGCNICVAFCPKQVLILKDGKVFPARPEICIGCKMCEMRCPDFAIEVHEKVEGAVQEPESPEVDFNLPPEARHA
jgi:2-oxoglutarate ferredoxin oxidoreductase subunit delta